jgi:hypothetical protein
MIILVLKAQLNHFLHLDTNLRKDMDKKFEQVFLRMDRFMIWSLGITITSTFFILGFLKFIL